MWEQIVNVIVESAPMWATAIVAVVSSITCVTSAINKAKDAVDEMRADRTLKDLSDKLSSVMQENEALISQQNILIDRIKHVESYMEVSRGKRK